MLHELLNKIQQTIVFLAHAWSDRRFPVLARMLLIFMSLYTLAPFDVLPDSMPGGLLDDATDIAAIFFIARHIVPRCVVIDARKAAALGVVFLSLTGVVSRAQYSLPSGAHCRQAQQCMNTQTPTQINKTIDSGSRSNEIESPASCDSANEFQILAKCSIQATLLRHIPAITQLRNIRLTTRNGQGQLYANLYLNCWTTTVWFENLPGLPHPKYSGGIFVVNFSRHRAGESC